MSSDFPRGWTLTSLAGAGSTASVTVPSATGVTHVLDGFTAKIVSSNTTTASEPQITLTSSDGVFAALTLALLAIGAAAAATNFSTDSATETALDLAAGQTASITIAFGVPAIASSNQFLLVQGHDI